MALLAPCCRMTENVECPCSAFSPADPKIVNEDINKMSKSQGLIDTTVHNLHTQLTKHFWFQLFRSADKIDEGYALVHLILPPPPAACDCKHLLILGHPTIGPPSPPLSHIK
jgi:hypothetical protein